MATMKQLPDQVSMEEVLYIIGAPNMLHNTAFTHKVGEALRKAGYRRKFVRRVDPTGARTAVVRRMWVRTGKAVEQEQSVALERLGELLSHVEE